jgi:large-conductance mechanosensitive channel
MDAKEAINLFSYMAIAFLILATLCFVVVGIATHKRDRAFNETMKEYHKQMEQYEKPQTTTSKAKADH